MNKLFEATLGTLSCDVSENYLPSVDELTNRLINKKHFHPNFQKCSGPISLQGYNGWGSIGSVEKNGYCQWWKIWIGPNHKELALRLEKACKNGHFQLSSNT